MTANSSFQIGDSVLCDFNGAQVPGVVQDARGGEYQVRLSQPWADESGNSSDTAWLSADRLSPNTGDSGATGLLTSGSQAGQGSGGGVSTGGSVGGIGTVAGGQDSADDDDKTIKDRVESEVFRDPAIPKGQLNINVAGGVVIVRGELESQSAMDSLVQQIRDVPGVKDVQSFLHEPGTPAPNKEEALDAS